MSCDAMKYAKRGDVHAVARSRGLSDFFLTCSWGLRPRLYAGACSAG
jgi:hypothetical protein